MQVLFIKIHSKSFLLGRSSNMKKCKFIKSGIAIAILGCSIIFTACDVNTDKKVEKQANKVVDAVESKDITKLDAIINGTDEIKEDEELKDFFETDTETNQKNGLMSKIIKNDTIKVKKVGKDTVTYKITAPDFSKYFTEMKKSEVTEENIESFKDLQQRLKKKDEHYTTPLEVPFITHWLHNMTHDQVLDMLKYLGMGNRPEDKVKVIFVPCYLDGKDGILNKHYYDLILGEDLSVYPSYYEPWGYTPLESVAFRVPTITTDLAGFGLWVNSLKNQHGINDGVEVLHRSDYNYSEVADGIKDTITLFSTKTDAEIKEIRKRAAQVAEQALWKHFIQYYYEAYDLALRNAMKRQLG